MSDGLEDALLTAAIERLLQRVPERWEEFVPDELSDLESKALFLLVAAGMVERRCRFRVKFINHPVCVEATITSTGEYGLVEAMQSLSAAMWETWKEPYKRWRCDDRSAVTPIHTAELTPQEWRLTDQGTLAHYDLLAGGRQRVCVFDFVLKRSFFACYPPVRGKGQLVRYETSDRKQMVESVNIGNWEQGAKEFAEAFGELVERQSKHPNGDNGAPPASEIKTPTPNVKPTEAAVDDKPTEPEHVFRPNGDGYDITFHESGHVSAVRCKGLHQIHRLIQTPMVPVLMTELEGGSFVAPHSRQDIADQATLKDVAAKLRVAKSELECATASQDRDTIDVEHCRQEVEKWEDELGKLLGLRGQVRDLNNPYDKKRPKIWGTINTAMQRLRDSGHSELADHLDGSLESERAWFVYVPKLNPIPNWKTEKKDASLRP